MTKTTKRARYTLEFKQEAARLVEEVRASRRRHGR
jgi:transposase-like protein